MLHQHHDSNIKRKCKNIRYIRYIKEENAFNDQSKKKKHSIEQIFWMNHCNENLILNYCSVLSFKASETGGVTVSETSWCSQLFGMCEWCVASNLNWLCGAGTWWGHQHTTDLHMLGTSHQKTICWWAATLLFWAGSSSSIAGPSFSNFLI